MKVKEIADFVKGELNGDGEVEISDVASLEKAKANELTFIEKPELLLEKEQITAGCVIVPKSRNIEFSHPSQIAVNNPKLSFAMIAEILHPSKTRTPETHPLSVVSLTAHVSEHVFIAAFSCIGERSEIGDGTSLMEGTKIGNDVKIGNKCVIHPNVSIEDGCKIGNGVILHSGVIIGADGFGYVKDDDENRHVKFPQIGKVIIEDNVEIGANSCVDRGALGETRIGEGTKIDNLVQVAHNVNIGKRVLIAAHTGISGSVTIEDDCVIAGQVGIADHVTIKKGSVIGAKSAVFPGKIIRGGYWSGIPVMPMDEYKKLNAHVKSLPRLKEELKKLKDKFKNLG